MVTMKQARAAFANRATLKPAEFESKHQGAETVRVQTKARVRVRRPLGTSFRAWARREYTGRVVSPKLAAIIIAGVRS